MLKLLPIKEEEKRAVKAGGLANCQVFRLSFSNREIQIAA
jgi:hypothetical protein